MQRHEMIDRVGEKFLTTNVENDEYSYPKEYKKKGLEFRGIKLSNGRTHEFADIRFENQDICIIIETKNDFNRNLNAAEEQLSAYVQYEKGISNKKIIAILANTDNDDIMVWRGSVSDRDFLKNERVLKSFDEYAEYYSNKTNNKEKVIKNTYALNQILHSAGIPEKLRSQFVGTCLLVLKNSKSDLLNKNLTTNMICSEMKNVLGELLTQDINKATKLGLLDRNVLDSQSIRELSTDNFRKILRSIKNDIFPFINDKSTAGQDLLNLFFVTFNKYVGKSDKNQAFTPDHITNFMTKLIRVNRNSRVLDPCCGSGSFLVRALMAELEDADTAAMQDEIKKNHIYGIEYSDSIYGLSTTNMLIHGDGNSNIYLGSCFDFGDRIADWQIDKVLMNPPYNATKNQMDEEFVNTWSKKQKSDPTKGLHFVNFIADKVKTGEMAVLLPVAAAIGNSKQIKQAKEDMLKNNTLKAVFTLPDDIFYPGASVEACCMVFELGVRHDPEYPTFFGYLKDDGFIKRKNLGRIENVDQNGTGEWSKLEKKWLNLYNTKQAVTGLSALKCVDANDEWLAEAYMKTDYSKLVKGNFKTKLDSYLAYKIRHGEFYGA
ncbi:HsdM family class I SAM-dependent methyltransferase [Limosilactobacillus vaginalis]|uniref:HsdM family class I SAM-dependent methyltransferase n=1 Tax=Limosilactobacillus vaginalis TaxID=1633 RepID=UPI0022E0D124|nr:N-6 DNA methylase [Limosilactobacillus vaginalis]